KQNKANVNIGVTNGDNSIYNTTVLVSKNVLQTIPGPNTDSEGIYKITAKTEIKGSQEVAWITIKVSSLFNSIPVYFGYLAVAFLAGLTILIIRGINSHS